MKIKRKIRQHRRDFQAVYVCGHCGHEQEAYGYDDAYFHENVIPAMTCPECGKAEPGTSSTPDVPAEVVL
jgi:predicted RNA-binding Zn-ribbon protein involved in translation (DUF1610 family)